MRFVSGVCTLTPTGVFTVGADASGRGASGALSNLLLQEPDFADRLEKQILKSCADLKLAEIRRPRHALWAWFLKELRSLGLETRNEWPFTMKTMGYPTLCRYADAVLSANPIKAARIVGGPQLEKKMVSGAGINRPVHNPFERVEMDAHKLDGRFVVMIPALDGGWHPRLIHRLWVIVLLDVASRAVIGYHLSLRVEVNKDDVIAAITKYPILRVRDIGDMAQMIWYYGAYTDARPLESQNGELWGSGLLRRCCPAQRTPRALCRPVLE